MRDPRQFDSADFYVGISILLYATGHWIGGTISLVMGIFIWLMFKIYSVYMRNSINSQNKKLITENNDDKK